MAVSVNMGTKNLRSDIMISDAELPQRVEQFNADVEKFEEMLAKADNRLRALSDTEQAIKDGKFDVPTVEELEKAGAVNIQEQQVNSLPDNPRELAKQILDGKVSIDDIPAEMITPKLLRELMILRNTGYGLTPDEEEKAEKEAEGLVGKLRELREMLLSGKIDEALIPDELRGLDFVEEITMLAGKRADRDVDDEEAEKPLDQNAMANLVTVDISDELVQLLGAFKSKDADENDPIGKIDFVEASALAEDQPDNQAESSDGLMEIIDEIVDNHVENAAEADVKTAEFTVNTEEAVQNVEVAVQNGEAAVQNVEAPVQNVEAAVQNVEAPVRNVEAVVQNVEAPVQNAETTKIPEIAEQNVEAAAQNVKSEVIPERAAQIGEAAEIVEEAIQNGEASKPEVKISKAVKTEASEQESALPETEGSVSVKAVDERAKALSEELEMLKNAKQKPESEPKTQDNNTSKAQIMQITDESVILRKNNGEMLVVSQKEIVSQVQKTVEQIISENREQSEYSLVLNPEELGKITVKMTKASDGAVSVTIVAENARTQRLLEQNSELMQSNLRNNGVNLESWQTVNESQQNHAAQDYQGSAKNPYSPRENTPEEDNDDDGRSFADIIAAM